MATSILAIVVGTILVVLARPLAKAIAKDFSAPGELIAAILGLIFHPWSLRLMGVVIITLGLSTFVV
jgi:vacuolar-type H+-ATPase subunit I/STV1